jgi:hypothetical protein
MGIRIKRLQHPLALPADDERQITLVSQAVGLGWRRGGLIWQRPLAVEVQRGTERQRIRIYDVTTLARLLLWLVALVVVLLLMLRQRRVHNWHN